MANSLITKSDLPYEILDFAHITPADVKEAIELGIAQDQEQQMSISQWEGTLDITYLTKIETRAEIINRAVDYLYNVVACTGDKQLEQLELDYSEKLSAQNDNFYLNKAIYHNIKQLEQAITNGELAVQFEDKQLVQKYLRDFRRAGIELDEAQMQELRSYNARLATITTLFRQKVVTGMQNVSGEYGGESVDFQLPTSQPALAYIENATERARIQQASISRGSGVDAKSDTRELILEIVILRAKRARLLGYANHAAYVADDSTAKTIEAIDELLQSMVAPTMRMAQLEAEQLRADMQKAEGADAEFSASDWAYYAQKRKSEVGVSDKEISPYLELNRVVEQGIFYVAGILYDLHFTKRNDLVGHTEEAVVWEVKTSDDHPVGLFVTDYYTRAGKRGGAWMNSFHDASALTGKKPVVSNNMNLEKPDQGKPTLLTWDEANTVFHEFGHALHGLLTKTKYPTISGTSVPRDFVEFPSQVNEMWLGNRQVLEHMLRHYETGEKAPRSLIDKILTHDVEGEGFHMNEMLAAVYIDQAWHRLSPEEVPNDPAEVELFEARVLEQAKLANALIPPRYRSTYFNHVFAGGYAAGYYSYLWSEAFDADTVAWFSEQDNDGLSRQAGSKFAEAVLSQGYSRDPLESFRELRGRDVDTTFLLRRHGLL